MNTKYLIVTAAALLGLAGTVQAQSAGSIVVSLGATTILPSVDSGDLTAPSLAGTKVDVNNASQVSGGITYYWTDKLAIELPLALPFKHDVVGAGAIDGVGKLGSVKALPATLLAQYHFGDAKTMIRPFVGAGLTYARFFKSKSTAVLSGITGGTPSNPTLLTMKSVWGPTMQFGVAANVSADISVELSVTKTLLKTTGRLSTGQTIETSLDPISVKFGIGYRF